MPEALLNTYQRQPIAFSHGKGVWLFDQDNTPYLDALSGLAVTGLGHNYPAVTQAIQEQAAKVIHTTNLFQIEHQSKLAEQLCRASGLSKAFFCNSGAEAIEGLIKLARLYGHAQKVDQPHIVVMKNAFHGRTMGAISIKSNPIHYQGFEPLLPGFIQIPFDDLNALEALQKKEKNIVAVLVEPVQGEGGIQVPHPDYLKAVRALCDRFSWLMMLDEIQTGMGRTGTLFAYQQAGILPDAISIAKGLANGIPIGAFLVRDSFSDLFKPGSHGSTFGGNPLATYVGQVVLSEIQNKNWINNAQKQGAALKQGLKKALKDHPHVVEIRGLGLMLGIELDQSAKGMMSLGLREKILFNIARDKTIRLLPPLIIQDPEIDLILKILPKIINEFTHA